ncbi:uncharacterized protein LOC21398602 [Morus notabilis]|uniref:uncharacterized protein LOC21398602 n=1 Tax=Morus notabilis TaxID=981085 RepID=UPI000CED40EF|nr:uncharacterized protein LOC21398602 [Morus notabilis]
MLINPKDVYSASRSYLQEVLKMYATELPTMNYAANTGKQSMFLERCVMNGKYCTLLLKFMPAVGNEEVIAAITYQIVPLDTQYAEIPLAAVSSVYQRKGIGRLLYMELRKRLQSVGVCSIICWGDKESEAFWHKQGFVSVAEVDVKGKARRLPIKADIRKALCFPGGSTLMLSHLKQDVSAASADFLNLGFPSQPNGKLSSAVMEKPAFGFSIEGFNTVNALNQIVNGSETAQPEMLVNDGLAKEDKKLDDSRCQDEVQGYRDSLPFNIGKSNKFVSVEELYKAGVDADVMRCSSTQGSGAKRVWEASLSSLKSKKVKGSYLVGCQSGSNWSLDSESGRDGSCYHTCPLVASENKSLTGLPPKDPSTSKCFKIMLMNIADDTKKEVLTKVITELGGSITSDGSTSTHVITGKVRATLNFCTALCSGAWVVSPSWLKESYRQGRFVDELPYILNDEEYALKYRAELRSAVLRAKASPQMLLKGYDVCIATHGQSSAKPLSTIVRSAGGNIIGKLSQVNAASKTIFVACEEDMDEAIVAVKKGIWTFSSDWLMNCVMRQELDFEAPQFAESL